LANFPASLQAPGRYNFAAPPAQTKTCRRDHKSVMQKCALLPPLMLAALLLFAQNSPQIAAVDPSSGKVNDTVNVTGTNLGKATVSAVFLSDDKNDYKATVVEQADDKIVMKVPQVKVGNYNVSIQLGDKILIMPVHFKVEQ
jgi:hypothetical protein